MILSAQSIRRLCPSSDHVPPPMIVPFHESTKAFGMSYGLSAAGYDIRIAEEIILGRGQFALASSIERFHMPNDVLGELKGKSSWARRGLFVFGIPIDPGFSGHLTIAMINHGNFQVHLRTGMPIAQILFQLLDEPTENPYRGKYFGQPARPVEAILEAAE